jgi:hypothetical protein
MVASMTETVYHTPFSSLGGAAQAISGAHAIPNDKRKGSPLMAHYSRPDIEALCKRLEVRASLMPEAQGRDLMAASLLLKQMMVLGDIQEVETSVGIMRFNDGQRPS